MTKHEKMATVRVSCMYKSSQIPQQAVQQVINPLTAADGLVTKMSALTIPQLEELNNKLNDLPRSSETGIVEVLAPYVAPEIVPLQNQIAQMKQQIQNFETQLDAVHSGVTVAFAEAHYQGQQYDYSGFYTWVEERIEQLREQQRKDAQERLQRELAAAQAAQQGAMDTDNLYSKHLNFRPKNPAP